MTTNKNTNTKTKKVVCPACGEIHQEKDYPNLKKECQALFIRIDINDYMEKPK